MVCGNLDGDGNQVGVFLDFAGDAHVDVLVADGHHQTSDECWVDLGGEKDGLVGLDEFLKRKCGEPCVRIWRPALQLTFNCDSNSLRWALSSGLAEVTSHTTSPRCAAMMSLKALMTASSFFNRPFSASCSKKNPVAGA